jgi:starch synthase
MHSQLNRAISIPHSSAQIPKRLTEAQFSQPNVNRRQRRNILFVTSEYSDLIKVGGLGDVSSALPKAILALHDIRILIPGYSAIVSSGHPIDIITNLPAHANLPECQLGRMKIGEGPIIYILICPTLYEREGNPYTDTQGKDWSDNHIRFARLGLAAAQIAKLENKLEWTPQIVHANDWPAALAPAYMKWQGIQTPSIFTIHNLAHQGLFSPDCMEELGLPQEAFTMETMEFHGKLSFLKAGIV